MGTYFLIGAVLLLVAGISEAVMDTLAHHFEESIFANLNKNWWNPVLSGNNKYINNDPTQKEKSVFFTPFSEGWHVFKFIRTSTLFFGTGLVVWAFVFYLGGLGCILGIVISIMVFKGIFTIYYEELKQTK